jgi:hypothetical protein
MARSPTVFLSYQRNSSADLARYLHDRLEALGVDVFFDVESINAGRFAAIIEHEIVNREHFLVILTPTTLESEWVRREVRIALDHQKPVIPVTTQGFNFAQHMHDDVVGLEQYSGIPYDYQTADNAIERIKRALGLMNKAPVRSASLIKLLLILAVATIVAVVAFGGSLVSLLFPTPTTTILDTKTPNSTESATTGPTSLTKTSLPITSTIATNPTAQTALTSFNVMRSPDTVAICSEQAINLAQLEIAFTKLGESYTLSSYFSPGNGGSQGCWCLQPAKVYYPAPDKCAGNNTRSVGSNAGDWRNSPVRVSLDHKIIGTCEPQPGSAEPYACLLK